MVYARAVFYLCFWFAVYLDGLLEELSASGVGCHWCCGERKRAITVGKELVAEDQIGLVQHPGSANHRTPPKASTTAGKTFSWFSRRHQV